MKYIFLIGLTLFSVQFVHANPAERAELDPTESQPEIPGTEMPLEKMNTAPTDVQLEEDNEFHGTLRARKQKQEELKKEISPLRKDRKKPK